MWQGFFDQLAFSSVATGVWSSTDKDPDVTISNSGLTATITNVGGVRARPAKSTGKRYFEITLVSRVNGTASDIGIASSTFSITGPVGLGADAQSACYTATNLAAEGAYRANGVAVTTGVPIFSAGDVIGISVDIPNHIAWAHRNGLYVFGDPSTGIGGLDYIFTTAVYPAVFNNGTVTSVFTANFGRTAFAHSIPTGFTSWIAP